MVTTLNEQLVAFSTFTFVGRPSPPSVLRTVSSRETEMLRPLNANLPSSPPTPGNHRSAFCLYESEFDHSEYLTQAESLSYLSICDQLISHSVRSSGFIHVGVCVRIPFLCKVK